MCDYCEKRKEIKSCNFAGSAKMIVSVGEFNILDIYGDESKFNIFKRIYRPRFDINYCPMCRQKVEGINWKI